RPRAVLPELHDRTECGAGAEYHGQVVLEASHGAASGSVLQDPAPGASSDPPLETSPRDPLAQDGDRAGTSLSDPRRKRRESSGGRAGSRGESCDVDRFGAQHFEEFFGRAEVVLRLS